MERERCLAEQAFPEGVSRTMGWLLVSKVRRAWHLSFKSDPLGKVLRMHTGGIIIQPDRKYIINERGCEYIVYCKRLALWRRLAILADDFLVGNYDRLDADWNLREWR